MLFTFKNLNLSTSPYLIKPLPMVMEIHGIEKNLPKKKDFFLLYMLHFLHNDCLRIQTCIYEKTIYSSPNNPNQDR